MVVFPNAKINIGLDVLNRRPDGYHDISTVMLPVPWCDVLEVVPANGDNDTLTVTGRKVDCPPEKNLVMKAVKVMRCSSEFPGVNIFLHKAIPDGAGLGGGSSDAAFTLMALNNLFSLGHTDSKLADMASEIGADCPFFIYNKPMLCEGTGTTLSPIDIRIPQDVMIAVVKPPVAVSTKEAYEGVKPGHPATPLHALLSTLPVNKWQGVVKNDFEASIFPRYPEIKIIKDYMVNAGAFYASMSGSGSSVFGLFAGDILTDAMATEFPGCDILVKKLFQTA